MKKGSLVICALVLLSLVATGVLLALMPDTVPVHFDAAGQIDRMGSKYVLLLLPAITAATGGLFVLIASSQRKKGETGNERTLLIAGVCVLAFLDALTAYFLYTVMTYSLTETPPADVTKFVFIGLGALLVVLGNLIVFAVLIVAWMAACLIASYQFYRREQPKK